VKPVNTISQIMENMKHSQLANHLSNNQKKTLWTTDNEPQ